MTTAPHLDILNRVLQQQTTDVFETYDSPNNAQDEFDDTTADGSSYFALLFILIFFFAWNSIIGSKVSVPLLFVLRGRCHPNFMFLLCPHWIVGIIVPIILGYSFYGPIGATFLTFITAVIPYGCFITYHIKTNDELRQLYSFCACIRNTNNNVNDAELSPRPYITREQQQVEIPTTGMASTNNNEKKLSSTTTDLLIIKKVRKASSKSKIDNTTTNSPEDEKKEAEVNHSFRFNNPKSDIFIPKSETKKKKKQTKKKKNKVGQHHHEETKKKKKKKVDVQQHHHHHSLSGSVQVCAICLEEYCVGDDIAYSKNINCHHFFHKQCVEQLLQQGHTECPICRNSYTDVWEDIELGGNNNNDDR